MIRNARMTRRLLALGSVALLLGAILPNVLYMGHLPIPGVAAQHEHSSSAQEVQNHKAHCHFGPPGCSDHSHPSNSSWPLADRVELPASGVVNTIIVSDTLDVPQVSLSPPEKPPQVL